MASEKSKSHILSPAGTGILNDSDHGDSEYPPQYAVDGADHLVSPNVTESALMNANTNVSPTTSASKSNVFQMIFGPDNRYISVSQLSAWKVSNAKNTVLMEKSTHHKSVFCYAINSYGDELMLYYGKPNNVPGWEWRQKQKGSASAASYESLKTWLTDILVESPQKFKNTRVVFGPDASYYATCGERYIWHDLPVRLLAAFDAYRRVWEKAKTIKAERDAHPETRHIEGHGDLNLRSQTRLSFHYFNVDAIATSWLPLHVALGPRGFWVAVWRETVAMTLPRSHQIADMLIDKPQNWTSIISMSLSPYNADHYFIAMDNWLYRCNYPSKGGLDVSQTLKAHVQAWVKLQPGRKVTWQNLDPISWQVRGIELLNQNTNFEYHCTPKSKPDQAKEQPIPKKEDQEKASCKPEERRPVEKQHQRGWLARLFCRKGHDTKS